MLLDVFQSDRWKINKDIATPPKKKVFKLNICQGVFIDIAFHSLHGLLFLLKIRQELACFYMEPICRTKLENILLLLL